MMNSYAVLTFMLLAASMYGADDQCADHMFQDAFHPVGIACNSGSMEIRRAFIDDRTYVCAFAQTVEPDVIRQEHLQRLANLLFAYAQEPGMHGCPLIKKVLAHENRPLSLSDNSETRLKLGAVYFFNKYLTMTAANLTDPRLPVGMPPVFDEDAIRTRAPTDVSRKPDVGRRERSTDQVAEDIL